MRPAPPATAPTARGIAGDQRAALKGMSDWYMATQLKNFKEGIRGAHPQDMYGAQMALMAAMLATTRQSATSWPTSTPSAEPRRSASESAFSEERRFTACRTRRIRLRTTREVEEVELYHPKTFIGKYIWSQDAKVIAIQYAVTAIGIGLVALVLSWLMRLQLGFPDRFAFIDPSELPAVRQHARDDHGDLPADGAVPGRLRQLPDPADGRRARHGVPVREHGELLGLPVGRAAAGGELLRARRAHRRGLDAVPAAGDPRRARRARTGASS